MFMMTDAIRMTISNTRPTIVPLLICTRLVLSTINGVGLYEMLASCVLHDTPTTSMCIKTSLPSSGGI